jgi:hypothetical protein
MLVTRIIVFKICVKFWEGEISEKHSFAHFLERKMSDDELLAVDLSTPVAPRARSPPSTRRRSTIEAESPPSPPPRHRMSSKHSTSSLLSSVSRSVEQKSMLHDELEKVVNQGGILALDQQLRSDLSKPVDDGELDEANLATLHRV